MSQTITTNFLENQLKKSIISLFVRKQERKMLDQMTYINHGYCSEEKNS